ncbi:MAG: CxxxxCH/CxxCH domain-containing protein [Ignavibacteria bacterium]|nr:CxxxxCH/CxxCH domain-containing protein [Ignavibacteria bacterium]
MKMLKIFYLFFTIVLFSALVYNGCSEIEDNLVTAPEIGTHPPGFADSNSTEFHGKFINDNKLWNLKSCQSCHGNDYAGGSSGSSCLTCHSSSGGPQNCRLCHGGVSGKSYPPKALNGETSISYIGVGVHTYHIDSTKYSAPVACGECHTALTGGFSNPNHIGDLPDGIAEINFGPIAKTVTTFKGGGVFPDPVWDRNTATCSNSYCHGTFRDGNSEAVPVWTDRNSVKCGSCHGDPVTGNPNPIPNGNFFHPHYPSYTIGICYQCHGSVIDQSGSIINKLKHVNGVVDYN